MGVDRDNQQTPFLEYSRSWVLVKVPGRTDLNLFRAVDVPLKVGKQLVGVVLEDVGWD